MKTVAVIGGGFGGIAAAIRLRARGNKVTIYERLISLGVGLRSSKEMVICMMPVPLLLQHLICSMNYLNYLVKI